MELNYIEIDPPGKVRASIIWLHGLGADGHDFEPIVPELGVMEDLGLRFIFPHAPERAVTINNGYVMRAWYDILSMEFLHREDEQGIKTSVAQLQQLVRREIERGVPSERIVVAGFSQGGAIALYGGLSFPSKLAGVLALSTYLPLAGEFEQARQAVNQDTPIMMAHGIHDDVVPLGLAELSHERLSGWNYKLEWHTYPMAHSVNPAEIGDIGSWLRKVLQP